MGISIGISSIGINGFMDLKCKCGGISSFCKDSTIFITPAIPAADSK